MSNILKMPYQRHDLDALCKSIKELVYQYSDTISLAEALGILIVVQHELIHEHE